MARIARDMLLAIGELCVNLTCHDDHHPPGSLAWIGVVGEVFLSDVAVLAMHAQRSVETTHDLNNLRTIHAGENLKILRHRYRVLFSTFLSKSNGG